jgi:hypothetical protein
LRSRIAAVIGEYRDVRLSSRPVSVLRGQGNVGVVKISIPYTSLGTQISSITILIVVRRLPAISASATVVRIWEIGGSSGSRWRSSLTRSHTHRWPIQSVHFLLYHRPLSQAKFGNRSKNGHDLRKSISWSGTKGAVLPSRKFQFSPGRRDPIDYLIPREDFWRAILMDCLLFHIQDSIDSIDISYEG